MKYKIIVSEKQARIISSVLDVYSRIQGGQFQEVLSRFNWKKLTDEEDDKVDEMLTDLKCMLIGIERIAHLGIVKLAMMGKLLMIFIK